MKEGFIDMVPCVNWQNVKFPVNIWSKYGVSREIFELSFWSTFLRLWAHISDNACAVRGPH